MEFNFTPLIWLGAICVGLPLFILGFVLGAVIF
jgi:hypothetical protein